LRGGRRNWPALRPSKEAIGLTYRRFEENSVGQLGLHCEGACLSSPSQNRKPTTMTTVVTNFANSSLLIIIAASHATAEPSRNSSRNQGPTHRDCTEKLGGFVSRRSRQRPAREARPGLPSPGHQYDGP
jgi:hypothetical protein